MAGAGSSRVGLARRGFTVRAQQGSTETETSRRAVLSLVAAGLGSAAFVKSAFAEATSIKIGPPPPPSGGLPGTLNSDEPRDLDLPLKNRIFKQPLPPAAAVARAKESAKDT
ncbi:photosystem II protein PsbQ, partial [Salmonella sp. s58953]|uniref:photosystem II protein PsbQ n=1 Tax=Salmonella sp. s58953 TaxID=3159711 RepID=UPI003980B4A6